MECSSCTLILALTKAMKKAGLTNVQRYQAIISEFTQGTLSFKEACGKLGISQEIMRQVLDEEFWDRKLKDG